MLLLVGLGNPGPGHAGNRHNLGFMAVDEIVRRHRFGTPRARFHGLVAEGEVAGHKIIALEPATYMNDSGRAVEAAAHFYKLAPEQVVVIHDEVDLPPGRLKVKRGGGAGGHNGIRSLDGHIGQDYRRVRIGIGHPGVKELVQPYVLQNFPAEEVDDWVAPLIDAVAQTIPLLLAGDAPAFMSEVARRCAPPDDKAPKDKAKD